jgi:hypothetical protein
MLMSLIDLLNLMDPQGYGQTHKGFNKILVLILPRYICQSFMTAKQICKT